MISTCHVGKCEGPIWLKQLSVGFHLKARNIQTNKKQQNRNRLEVKTQSADEDLDLPDIEGIMGSQVAICFHNLEKGIKTHENF